MNIEIAKDNIYMLSAVIVVAATGLFIPWGILIHSLQFIAILIGVILLNREYKKLLKLYEKGGDIAESI